MPPRRKVIAVVLCGLLGIGVVLLGKTVSPWFYLIALVVCIALIANRYRLDAKERRSTPRDPGTSDVRND
jgi:drug/metabolite transporter (DMT)-like permease